MATKSGSTVAGDRGALEGRGRQHLQTARDEPTSSRAPRTAILNSFVFTYDSKAKILNQQLHPRVLRLPGRLPGEIPGRDRDGRPRTWIAAAKKYIRRSDLAILVVGKATDFDKPLSTFGTVIPIDIDIPAPGASKAAPPAAGSAEGKALIAKVAEGLGGAAKLATIKSYKFATTLNVKGPMGAMSIDTDELTVFPDKQRQIMKTPMGEMTMVVTPDVAFANTPMGLKDIPGSQKKSMLDSIRDSQVYLAQKANDPAYTFAVAGTEKIGSVDAKILVINGEGLSVKWYVDPATGTVLRTVKSSAQGEQMVDLSDVRDVSGIKFPFKGAIKMNGEEAGTFEVKEIVLNPTIDPKAFDKPAAK